MAPVPASGSRPAQVPAAGTDAQAIAASSSGAPSPTTPIDPEYKKAIIREVEKHSFLKEGASGPQVVELQTRMASFGIKSKDPSGTFGPDTKKAVEKFQKLMDSGQYKAGRKFAVDGLVGDQTWGALLGLTGINKLKPGRVHVGRHADEYQAMGEFQPATPEQRANFNHIYQALANMKSDDLVTPEVCNQVVEDLFAGRAPQVDSGALSDLGLRMVEAAREDKPRSDMIYPTSHMNNGDFDFMIYNLLGDTLTQDPAAVNDLLCRLTNPQEKERVKSAVTPPVLR